MVWTNNDHHLCVPLFKMKNYFLLVFFPPSPHYNTPLHSISGSPFYFQVPCLMNTRFIHLQPEMGGKEGREVGSVIVMGKIKIMKNDSGAGESKTEKLS